MIGLLLFCVSKRKQFRHCRASLAMTIQNEAITA
jgi:hypothetical protein